MAKLVRIDESAHRMAKSAAARSGQTLEQWLTDAIKDAVSRHSGVNLGEFPRKPTVKASAR